MDAALQQQASNVLDLLSRVQQLFGGERLPADPPAFVPPPELEAGSGPWLVLTSPRAARLWSKDPLGDDDSQVR